MKLNDIAAKNALIRDRLAGEIEQDYMKPAPELVVTRRGVPTPASRLPRRISVIPVPGQPDVEVTIKLPAHLAPAFKSAITEIRNEIGGRLEQPHAYATEDALTRAAAALGILATALNAEVENYDPAYKARVGSIE